MQGRPLAVASALFAVGVALGVGLAVDAQPVWPGFAATGAALLLGLRSRRPSGRSLARLLAPLCVGLLRGAAADLPERDLPLDAVLETQREPLLIEGLVVASERAPAEARRLLIDLEARELWPGAAVERLKTPVRVLLTVGPSDDPALLRQPARPIPRPGDRVRLLARLRVPPRRLNPGGPDRRRQLALRGIAYDGSATFDGLVILASGSRWARLAGEWRDRFAARCAEVCGSPERGALVAALAVGDRADIPPDVDDDLAASGLIHLLASAGLHVAAVCVLVQRLAGKAWLFTPWAARIRASLVAGLCALPFAAIEVLLLGAPWPALRAGLSAALWLLAPVAGRRAESVTALALSAALCATFDPGSLHDLPLQLSLAGVAGLIFLTGPLRDLGPLRRLRFPAEHILRLGCATAAAMLCTAPLLAATFPRLSLVSVLANAAALWPGLVAIPIATAAVAADALSPTLSLPLLWAADLCALATLEAARFFAALPGARVPLATPGLFATLAWAIALLLFAGFPAPIGPGTALDRPAARVRIRRASVPLAALALLWAGGSIAQRFTSTLSVAFLAVGQGDAALVRFPGGRAMLIDAGGALFGASAGRADPGGTRVLPALAELGVGRLDWAVLTHPHPDHGGGLFAVLDRVEVGELWTTGEPGPDLLGDRLRARARERGVAVIEPRAGQILEVDGVRVEVLHPARFRPDRDANDNSIVLRLVHGEVTLLLAGDLEAISEAELAQGSAPLAATLLKAAHHGSRTSSTEAFIRRVRPRHVVFCVGPRNPFGFPHADVIARYQEAGCKLWRTDRGAVIAESDGRTLRVRGPDG